MSEMAVLICGEDQRSCGMVAQDLNKIGVRFGDRTIAASASEARTWLGQHDYKCLVVISEKESAEERLALEALCAEAGCFTCFVNLRANHVQDDAAYKAVPCSAYLGCNSYVDSVRRAIKRAVAPSTKKERTGWR